MYVIPPGLEMPPEKEYEMNQKLIETSVEDMKGNAFQIRRP
jgi:hypothetical protein